MKLIPISEADSLWRVPALQYQATLSDAEYRTPEPFPNMRASAMSLVFSFGYMVKLSRWWEEWKRATGFKYVPGSAMCESGTKVFIAHVHEAVLPFRGEGPVDPEIVEQARLESVIIPAERLGDFTPEVRELRIAIPRGVSVNGVTDGGHSTPGLIVEEPDGRIVANVWEWQNSKWTPWEELAAKGVYLHDAIE